MIAAAVSSEVCRARITSTSFRTGTGLKKCMPITRSGRPRDRGERGDRDRRRVRREDRALRAAPSSARRKTSSLTSASSTTASIIRSASTRSSAGVTRASTSSAGAPPFSASFFRLLRIAASPRSVAPGYGSCSDTRRPDAATTCAMPPPICPAPTTRTCSNSTRGGYSATGSASLGSCSMRRRPSTNAPRREQEDDCAADAREHPGPREAARLDVRDPPVRRVQGEPRVAAFPVHCERLPAVTHGEPDVPQRGLAAAPRQADAVRNALDGVERVDERVAARARVQRVDPAPVGARGARHRRPSITQPRCDLSAIRPGSRRCVFRS